MARDLTSDERAVLAHVVVDPDAWWTHCQAALGSAAVLALSAKVTRWRPSYESAKQAQGYAPRVSRPEAAPALPVKPQRR